MMDEQTHRVETYDARPDAPMREGEISRMENALDRLTAEIERLEVGLEPVLEPETPHTALAAEKMQRSRLGDRIDRLENLCGRLSYLQSRISL